MLILHGYVPSDHLITSNVTQDTGAKIHTCAASALTCTNNLTKSLFEASPAACLNANCYVFHGTRLAILRPLFCNILGGDDAGCCRAGRPGENPVPRQPSAGRPRLWCRSPEVFHFSMVERPIGTGFQCSVTGAVLAPPNREPVHRGDQESHK